MRRPATARLICFRLFSKIFERRLNNSVRVRWLNAQKARAILKDLNCTATLTSRPSILRYAIVALQTVVAHRSTRPVWTRWRISRGQASINPKVIPRDPFTKNEPVRYELRYDKGQYVPYIWSISADKVSQNGDRLRAHPNGFDDWRIAPVKWFSIVEHR